MKLSTKHVPNQNAGELHCVSGIVRVLPPVGLGAVLGEIRPEFGAPIPLRQVVGPAGGPVPLTAVVGEFATVCGRFITEDDRVILDVRQVVPRPPQPTLLPLLLLLLLVAGLALLR